MYRGDQQTYWIAVSELTRSSTHFASMFRQNLTTSGKDVIRPHTPRGGALSSVKERFAVVMLDKSAA